MSALQKTLLAILLFPTFIVLGADKKTTEKTLNHLYNSSFELGDSLPDALAWNRMRDISYTIDPDCGWQLDTSDAFHGKRSLLASPDATTLTIPQEIWATIPGGGWTPWVFSIYLKADKEDYPCEVQIGSYKGFNCAYQSKLLYATTHWKRFEMKIANFRYRSGAKQGPTNIRIIPKGEGIIRVDAMQWEPGEKAGQYTPGFMENGRYPIISADEMFKITKKRDKSLKEFSVLTAPLKEKQKTALLKIPFKINSRGKKIMVKAVPVIGGIPFRAGTCNGYESFSLFNLKGDEIPVQSHVLCRWPQDKSVRSLGIIFETDLKHGDNHLTLQSKPDQKREKTKKSSSSSILNKSRKIWKIRLKNTSFFVDPASGKLWSNNPIRKRRNYQAELIGHGLDGKMFSSANSPGIITEVEYNGPIYASVLKRGILTSSDGEGLLEFVCRLHFFYSKPGVEAEVCIINPLENGTVIIRDLALKIPVRSGSKKVLLPVLKNDKTKQDNNTFYEYYSNAEQQFRCTVFNYPFNSKYTFESSNRSPAWIVRDNSMLIVRDPWQKHPSMVTSLKDSLYGYFWPDSPATGIFFSRGMSVTRFFQFLDIAKIRPSKRQGLIESQTIRGILPDKEYFSNTDFFMMPIGYSDPQKYPFMEKMLEKAAKRNLFSETRIENAKLYGLFDYGDVPGDGGWSNLESFQDYTSIIGGLCTGSSSMLNLGLKAAEHYRDIDTNQYTGIAHYHNSNHVMGPEAICHFWPQGIYSHYLLTASRRSYEVAMLTAWGMLKIPVDSGRIKGSRQLARYLLGLADLHALCGNQKLKERFFEQLNYAEEKLAASKSKDRTIFPWAGRLDPYQVWYGVTAFMEMYILTGDDRLLKSIHRELDASLNMDFYRLDLEQLWPGLPPEKIWPIELAYRARHRGSCFYPIMNLYSRITGDTKWQKLAAMTAYADFMRDKRHKTPYEIFKFSVINANELLMSEDKLLAEAKELVFQAAAPTLLNGNFSDSKTWWEYWKPYSRRQMSYDSLRGKWDITTAGSAEELDKQWSEEKKSEVSPWQYYRRRLANLDWEIYPKAAPSLRINLDSSHSIWSTCLLDTARIKLNPGLWRISGSFRIGQGIDKEKLTFRVKVYPLNGDFTSMQFPLSPKSGNLETDSAGPDELLCLPQKAFISLPDKNNWQNLSFEFENPKKSLMNLLFLIYLDDNAEKGKFYIDDFKLEKISTKKM